MIANSNDVPQSEVTFGDYHRRSHAVWQEESLQTKEVFKAAETGF